MENNAALRQKIVSLAVAAGEGGFSERELADAGHALSAVGFSSLAYMRLIDSIENELGVYLDPEADVEHYESIDSIAALVVASSGEVHA
ncbi:phosphopantetheine-binding protein [Streptomyces sp. NPDC051784]|uniref:phosphopantetheine-binding protein n=1 Tax=Streptomyces sp. NPDC051784 TaxID=3155805 RepID=UPI003418A092